MDKPVDQPEKPSKLVDMFAAEKRPEQHGSMDRKLEKRFWTARRIALAAFAALFLAFVGYQLLYGTGPSTLNVDAEKLTISEATYGPFQEYIVEQGTIAPLTTIYLDATDGGRVEEVFVEQGSQVRAADAILRLSNPNLQLNVMQREADLFRETNNLRQTRVNMETRRLDLRAQRVDLDYQLLQAKREYERHEQLLKQNLISRQEYDRAKDLYDYIVRKRDVTIETQKQDSLYQNAQVEQLEESISRMGSNLKIVKSNQENLTLRAPVDGLLSSLNAEIGESKSPGQRLGQIDVEEGFKVRVGIDEHYIARVSPGQSASFDFSGKTYDLAIRRVYPEVVDGQFQADMAFAGPAPNGLRRGQTLQVRIALGELVDAIQIPRGGFYQKTGGQWMYALDPSGDFAVRRPIKLGRQNSRFFEVLEGLQPGDKVITSMYDNFGDMERLALK